MLGRNRYILSKPQWLIVAFVAFCAALIVPLVVYSRKALGQWFSVIEFTGVSSVNVALTSLLMFLCVAFAVGLFLHHGNEERRRKR